MRNKRRIALVSILLGLLTGCGSWPPVVDSGAEIRRLDVDKLDESAIRVRGLPDEDIPELIYVADIRRLDFSSGWAVMEALISNDGLRALSKISFTQLEHLDLGHCNGIGDEGLVHLTKMKTVRWLSLMACENISDEGLKNLKPMRTLRVLDLRGCPKITDAGLGYLAEMKHLQSVMLGGCPNVTARGVGALQKSLPDCRVEKDEREWSFHQQ